MTDKPSLNLNSHEVEQIDEEILKLLNEIKQGQKSVVVLTDDEIKELKQWLEDKKALGRVWSILKTAALSIAAVIVAWNTIFEGGIKAVFNFFGGGTN